MKRDGLGHVYFNKQTRIQLSFKKIQLEKYYKAKKETCANLSFPAAEQI